MFLFLLALAQGIIIPINFAEHNSNNTCARRLFELLGNYEIEFHPENVDWSKYDWTNTTKLIPELERDAGKIYTNMSIHVLYNDSDYERLEYLQSQSSTYNILLELAGVNTVESLTWPQELGNFDACLALGDEFQWCTSKNIAKQVSAAICVPYECSIESMKDPTLLIELLSAFGENLYTGSLTCTNNFIQTAEAISHINWTHFDPVQAGQALKGLKNCFMQQRVIDYLNTFTNLAAYTMATQGSDINCISKEEQRVSAEIDWNSGTVLFMYGFLCLIAGVATTYYAYKILRIQLKRDEDLRVDSNEYGMLDSKPKTDDRNASAVVESSKEPFERKPWEKLLFYWCLQDSLYECFYPGRQVAFPALDGIRAMAMLQVVLGHSAPFILTVYNYSNPTKVWGPDGEVATFTGQAFPACYLAVDTFFWLSGFLAAYICIKKLSPPKNVTASGTQHMAMSAAKIPFIWLNRWLRLLIPVFFVMLFKSYVMPLWLDTIPKGSSQYHGFFDVCRGKDFLYNMLFIMNDVYSGANRHICLGVTWYLQVDLRIFLFIPVFILFYVYVSKKGAFALTFAALVAHLIALGAWFANNHDGSSLDNDPGHGKYQTDIYFTTWGRYGPICVGVMFAMAWDMWLKKFKKVTWEKQTAIILTCSTICLYLAYGTYGTYDQPMCTTPGQKNCGSGWNYAHRALWGSTHRVLWVVAVTGVAFLCFKDQFPGVNFILSHEFWKPLARLSFLMYLIHLDVIIYTYLVNTPRRIRYSRLWFTIYYSGLVLTTALCALVLFCLIEKPFGKLIKLFLGSLQKAVSKSKKKREPLAGSAPVFSGIQSGPSIQSESTDDNEIAPAGKAKSFVNLLTDTVTDELRQEGEQPTAIKEDSLGHTYS